MKKLDQMTLILIPAPQNNLLRLQPQKAKLFKMETRQGGIIERSTSIHIPPLSRSPPFIVLGRFTSSFSNSSSQALATSPFSLHPWSLAEVATESRKAVCLSAHYSICTYSISDPPTLGTGSFRTTAKVHCA